MTIPPPPHHLTNPPSSSFPDRGDTVMGHDARAGSGSAPCTSLFGGQGRRRTDRSEKAEAPVYACPCVWPLCLRPSRYQMQQAVRKSPARESQRMVFANLSVALDHK